MGKIVEKRLSTCVESAALVVRDILMEEIQSTSGRSSAFPSTQWTLVIEAVSENPDLASRALEKLCGVYRDPIVNWFGRRCYNHDGEDMAHEFIAYLLNKNLLSRLTPRTGRLRFFLADCMRKFLSDESGKASALKRGGDIAKVPLADGHLDFQAQGPADSQLDLDFALVIHRKVMDRLAPTPELIPYLFQKETSTSWDSIAARLQRTSVAVRKEVSRLRRAHWETFRDEVASIVMPGDTADETRYLYELLFRHLPVEL